MREYQSHFHFIFIINTGKRRQFIIQLSLQIKHLWSEQRTIIIHTGIAKKLGRLKNFRRL